jgi:predicted site-specific integrase-resolvase
VIAPVLLTRKEAAARLRVSIATIKRWEAAGLLDARHIGPATVRVTEASVLARARSRRNTAA